MKEKKMVSEIVVASCGPTQCQVFKDLVIAAAAFISCV